LVDNKPKTTSDKQIVADVFGDCYAYPHITTLHRTIVQPAKQSNRALLPRTEWLTAKQSNLEKPQAKTRKLERAKTTLNKRQKRKKPNVTRQRKTFSESSEEDEEDDSEEDENFEHYLTQQSKKKRKVVKPKTRRRVKRDTFNASSEELEEEEEDENYDITTQDLMEIATQNVLANRNRCKFMYE